MRLNELHTGDTAIIVKILGHGAFRKRMIEMGFVKGHEVEVLLHAPLKDPIKYSIMGYEISLRSAEAHMVEVLPVEIEGESELSDLSPEKKTMGAKKRKLTIMSFINVAKQLMWLLSAILIAARHRCSI